MLFSVSRVFLREPVEHETGSELALALHAVAAAEQLTVSSQSADSLLFVAAGSGELTLGGQGHELAEGSAALVLAAETATVTAAAGGLEIVRATVGPYVDRHAPIGARDVVVPLDRVAEDSATGKRSFQIIFGPHNGSTRATLFAGSIPPGQAPWHYHLYDEIVWVPAGPGRLHLEGGVEELGPRAAFRLHAREVHIVENAGAADMLVLGVFTPAGSPAAAYLPAGSEAAYSFTSR
jgi:quercetin dioxygenase-like cupin family protein